jgi:hypothetical protein
MTPAHPTNSVVSAKFLDNFIRCYDSWSARYLFTFPSNGFQLSYELKNAINIVNWKEMEDMLAK